MKNRNFIILYLACTVIPVLGFAQTTPTGDTPVGFQAANSGGNASPSGKVLELQVGVPVEAETTMGQRGWLKMDGHGAYWWGRNVDANGNLVGPMSATQGTYMVAHGESVVVK